MEFIQRTKDLCVPTVSKQRVQILDSFVYLAYLTHPVEIHPGIYVQDFGKM